jgi:two-component system chemotaxis response regulator CheY
MKRCMFVDDSSMIRKVAKRILSGPEVLFVEASTGIDAIDMCEADMPHVIFIDAVLPDMLVEDAIRRIRAIPSPIIPQIAISLVEMDIPAIMRAKRAGAQHYLLKPLDRTQLVERYRTILLSEVPARVKLRA